MSKSSDIEILAEQICGEPLAAKGSHITYSARIYLRRGEEVTPDFESIRRYGDRVATTEVDGVQLIEHSLVLGKRRTIAGIERILHSLQLSWKTVGAIRYTNGTTGNFMGVVLSLSAVTSNLQI